MTIVDINGKTRNIKSLKKIKHKVVDARSGKEIEEDFIEVEIIGKNREWVEFWPVKDFVEQNPIYSL